MDKNVFVYADTEIIAMWDGVEYTLGTTPVEVKQGVAEHWQGLHEGVRFEDVPEEVIEQRAPQNPIEQNNRGTAFADLKNVNAAIRAKGKELGIKGAHNMNIDKLKEAIEKVGE